MAGEIENVLAPADAQALREWNRVREIKQQRFADLAHAKEVRAHLSQMEHKERNRRCRNALETAKANVQAAAASAALAEYNRTQSELATARATLAEWGKQEQQINLEMSGRRYIHPFTGLTATPTV